MPPGTRGGEKLTNSALGDWDMAAPVFRVTCPGPADHEMLLCGTFVISLWPIIKFPTVVTSRC